MTYEEASEIIAEWMEPSPASHTRSRDSERGWWRIVGVDKKNGTWIVNSYSFTLDRLYRVEDRLSDEQWDRYRAQFTQLAVPPPPVTSGEYFKLVAHATVEQKAIALAKVIQETKL